MESKNKIATILHISDLHIVKDLSEKGSRFKMSRPTYLTKSHSREKLVSFVSKILSLRVGGQKDDIIVGTGDITTDGSKGAIETALDFIENEKVRVESPIDRPVTYGLNANKYNRLIIPGNHDRYGGKRLPLMEPKHTFEENFEVRDDYPYVVGYRPPSSNQNDPDSPIILFFVFDSNPPLHVLKKWYSKNWLDWIISPLNFRKGIARGHVTGSDFQSILVNADNLVKEKKVKGFGNQTLEFNPLNCIRIAVLHHHPVIKKGESDSHFTLMEGNEEFVKFCIEAGIQLVLFGHQHKQYNIEQSIPAGLPISPFGKINKIHFLCCPSTTEYSVTKNGFYHIDVFKDGIKVNLYEWNGKSFESADLKDEQEKLIPEGELFF